MLIGPSGAGKSSLINYLAGSLQANVGDGGKSCTKGNASYEATLMNTKLNIIDTQGFNDTDEFTSSPGQVAKKIMLFLIKASSTRQIDAVWIVHDAKS